MIMVGEHLNTHGNANIFKEVQIGTALYTFVKTRYAIVPEA